MAIYGRKPVMHYFWGSMEKQLSDFPDRTDDPVFYGWTAKEKMASFCGSGGISYVIVL